MLLAHGRHWRYQAPHLLQAGKNGPYRGHQKAELAQKNPLYIDLVAAAFQEWHASGYNQAADLSLQKAVEDAKVEREKNQADKKRSVTKANLAKGLETMRARKQAKDVTFPKPSPK